MQTHAAPLIKRFWSHVDKTGDCWLWTGSKDKRGYGRISPANWRDAPLVAPRVSWEIANRRMVPSGMFVMHSCDNPPCVNPAHLSIGTAKDNAMDASRKGRMAVKSKGRPGSAHHKAKLSDQDVRTIRAIYDQRRDASKRMPPGATAALVRRFGVGKDVICGIAARKTWTHI